MTDKPCGHPRKIVFGSERLTRFVFDSKYLQGMNQAIFKVGHTLKFSTYRTTRNSEAQIWAIGKKHVETNKPILGRVDLAATSYTENNLQFEPNGKPHTRHNDVIGWNTNKPDDLEKRMALAQLGAWTSKRSD
jgi:hypothetical protein